MGCGGGWRKSPDVPQAVTSELPPNLPRNSLLTGHQRQHRERFGPRPEVTGCKPGTIWYTRARDLVTRGAAEIRRYPKRGGAYQSGATAERHLPAPLGRIRTQSEVPHTPARAAIVPARR